MSIKHVLITGDTHSKIKERLQYIKNTMPGYIPEETAVIVLGDFGANYHKTKHDWETKYQAAKFGYTIYALRGNHEDRASNMKNPIYVVDDFVEGVVCYEEEFPNIRYFMDCVAEYVIMDRKVLCIPGAYSVDKWYRLKNGWQWFPEEQLSAEEMKYAEEHFSGKHYDVVLSHTCPISWEPRDLFLKSINQSQVDKTMENWMGKFKDMISWELWLFGHFHSDRIERPYVEQFYTEIEDLDTILARWTRYHKTKELDWQLPKSPNFYMGIEE